MKLDLLIISSVVALVIRVAAIGLLLVVAWIQINQFKVVTRLQPLKRMLLGAVLTLIIANLPIVYLHWLRILNIYASDGVSSLVTITNSVSTLITAALLWMVYRFKSGEPPR